MLYRQIELLSFIEYAKLDYVSMPNAAPLPYGHNL
jgi:hypothetical protein